MFIGVIFGEVAAADKRGLRRPCRRYLLSSGNSRSSSSSNGIEPRNFTPLRKKVGVDVTFSS
jgi:hypothetical protein